MPGGVRCMQHIKVSFSTGSQDVKDVLMAMLGAAGFEGFEEQEHKLLAYMPEENFNKNVVDEIVAPFAVAYDTEVIPMQNWNALWESNFQPVVVDDFCAIRAHFHEPVTAARYEIVITPKMSFGTGHHATTQQMILQMKDMDLMGKSLLDFGTGTGVLAILAEMLGATDILAIDNDEWSVENALENISRNNCTDITVALGTLEDFKGVKKDVILANINRHILLHYMAGLYLATADGGMILMSGLLAEDEVMIMESALAAGFSFLRITEQANWISLLFAK